MADRIAIRRGTAAEWTSANPILIAGEQGFETDTLKTKIGNGVDAWTTLSYLPGGGLQNVSEDATPSLGGDLDASGNTFNTTSYRQIAAASVTGTHSFDYALGDAQEVTITGDTTFSMIGFPTGNMCDFIIEIVNGGAFTITWPAGTSFAGNVAPGLTAAGKDMLNFHQDEDDALTLFPLVPDVRNA